MAKDKAAAREAKLAAKQARAAEKAAEKEARAAAKHKKPVPDEESPAPKKVKLSKGAAPKKVKLSKGAAQTLPAETEPAAADTIPALDLSIDALEQELKRSNYRVNYGKVLRSTIFSLVVVAAVAVLIVVLFLPVLQITGTSMTPTLEDNEIVLAMNGSKYETGDVIAFYYNNTILVKRVIATAGQWVDIDEDGNVYVDNELIDEPYLEEKALGDCDIDLPYQVPDERLFVMGDHRATSVDSRNSSIGCISADVVIGRLLFSVWPLNCIGFVN